MRKIFWLFTCFFLSIFSYAQKEADSIQYFSMINFIIENKSLLSSYIIDLNKESKAVNQEYLRRYAWEINRDREMMADSVLEQEQVYMKKFEKAIENEEYGEERLYIIQNEMQKIICFPPDVNNQLQKYYPKMNADELYSAIRYDFYQKYSQEKIHSYNDILNKLNCYLDSIVRSGENIDTTKSYWAVLFSDSFYSYKSAMIYYHTDLRSRVFALKLEIIFLFDEKNRIKMVDFGIVRS